jgi:hypothetical protein
MTAAPATAAAVLHASSAVGWLQIQPQQLLLCHQAVVVLRCMGCCVKADNGSSPLRVCVAGHQQGAERGGRGTVAGVLS